MTTPCDQLVAYAARDLDGAAAEMFEEHLFSCQECATRAEELDAILRGVRASARAADVTGFVTDDVLNRLSREGVRLRTFTLAPGDRVPCAVWADDEVMAIRLRGDLGEASEITLTQSIAGTEILRLDIELGPGHRGEVIQVISAAQVRQLPEAEIELSLSARERGKERRIGTYTLVHEGALQR
jgi:anti-sigma factor RsiW